MVSMPFGFMRHDVVVMTELKGNERKLNKGDVLWLVLVVAI